MRVLPDDADRPVAVEDQAAITAELFLAEALRAHVRAFGGEVIERGVCSNCGERCLPGTVYCDADCRADHERTLGAVARRGRTGGAA